MKLEDFVQRVDELLRLCDEALSTKRSGEWGAWVDSSQFVELRSATLSFLANVFGTHSSYYKEFDTRVSGPNPDDVKMAIGVLKACRGEIVGGWIFSTRSLVSAEVFSDFLEMAEYLLSENYKDAAAVMIGGVLEEHLRQLCRARSISVEVEKSDGAMVSSKAESLNADLAKAGVYSKLDQKNVTAWLDLRNKAAHGKYSEYSEEQVRLMLQSIMDFMTRTQNNLS